MSMPRNSLFTKDFTLVIIGQIISIFGNQMLRYALPLYLLNQTGSSALFGTILAVSFLPMLLLYPVGGIIADRLNKRNIMVALDFGTAALMLLFCLLSRRVSLVPLTAVTMMALYGIQGAYQPAVQASVPALVRQEQLMRGNSVVNMISSLASMVGPVVGGIVFSLAGLTPILYLSCGCFFASAVMELFIQIPYERRADKGGVIATGLGDLRESFGFLLWKRPILWKVSLIYAAVNLLLTSLVLIGAPVLITQHLGFPPDTANRMYGYAQGVLAAGAVLGGLLAGLLAERLTSAASPYLLLGCALSVLLGGLGLQVLTDPGLTYAVLLLGCSLLLVLSTLFQIQIMSYIQILTPRALTGKVIACVICICMCTNPLGQLIYGIVFEQVGGWVYLPFYVAALLMAGIAVGTRRLLGGIDRLIDHSSREAPAEQGRGRAAGAAVSVIPPARGRRRQSL